MTFWGVARVIVVLLGATYLWWTEARPRAKVAPLSDLQVAEDWLQCIDCQGPYLKRLHETQGRNRDSVTRFLRTALQSGPDSSRRERLHWDLSRTWHADSMRRVRRGEPAPPDSERVSFLGRYTRSFEVVWRGRAATALGVLRDTSTLNQALQFPLSNQGDSTILGQVKKAIADTGLTVLGHYP
jgi:hypothetical protein